MRPTRQPPSCARGRHRASRAQLCLLLLATTCLTGCGGCNQSTPQQTAQKKKKELDEKALEEAKKKLEEAKKKKPFEISRLTPLLSESLIETEEGLPLRLAKPGHWTTTVQPMRANLDDFEGRVTLSAVDARGNGRPLPHTPFEMTSSRPAVLAKGRTKRIESELLAPADSNKLNVKTELESSIAGSIESQQDPWTLMPSHQYFLVVLSREPGRYAFLKVADSIRAPYEDDNGTTLPHYRVVLADAKKPLPLPGNVLTWTSVAYVVWDEVNLDRMDPAQQRALVDWLHWGGRLIINGPDSLEALRGSFLASYLPADPGGSRDVDADDLIKLSKFWSVRRQGQQRPAPIAVTRPWSGIELKPRAGAVALPGGEGLFYEAAVGAGSMVVSAVQLAERDLINWTGYDGFLNGALLRRPARTFRVEKDGTWTGLQSDWADYERRTLDAYFTTPLRWFARDAATKANALPNTTASSFDPNQNAAWNPGGWAAPETEMVVDRPGGLGEWSEFGPVSEAAREVLREAAGVRVPGSGFVVACLAVYLVVLVPLNWMLFHALGRIEWAWIAAPIIALVGTVVVVRQAQLDIGFVRSQTEIALLELQGDHPRGHLSRYTALYSSLSTTYDLQFNDATAVATPFPPYDTFELAIGDRVTPVAFEKYDQPRLRGVTISSASTQMVHSEQIYPLAGAIRMTSPSTNPNLRQLENKSGFDLADAVVVHRRVDDAGKDNLVGCWLGQVRSGGSVLLPWGAVEGGKNELPFAAERAKAGAVDYHKRLNVDPLLKLAFAFPAADDPLHGNREEYRLVARIDETLPGADAAPAASQTTGTTVVLAHLHFGAFRQPTADANSPIDVMPEGRRNAYEEAYTEDSGGD